ncbi:MAG TPA: hypothetical protein PLP05_08275 [Sedimentisphaerales bacterium]|nr:hypothetical protein [Sedimentisphaerales bacterium]
MKNKKIWIATAALLAISITLVFAAENKTESQDLSQGSYIADDKETLKGLEGFHVNIEELKSPIERSGLTTAQIRSDVELRLRQNGIKVLSEEELLAAPGNPQLYVNVNILAPKDFAVVAYSIVIRVDQAVFLARDTTKKYCATTWNRGSTGIVNRNLSTIRDDVKNKVDEFISDYLAVNPKNK